MHTTNYDQLYAYLSQHEVHSTEVCQMRKRFSDPLALVANYHHIPSYQNTQAQCNPSDYQQQMSLVAQPVLTLSQTAIHNLYEIPHHQTTDQAPNSHSTPSMPQNAYQAPAIQQPQAEFPQLDSGLAVPSFLPGYDSIASLNKAMTFLSATIASRYPTTNNQLKTSSNPRNQAIIQDDRVRDIIANITHNKSRRKSAERKAMIMFCNSHLKIAPNLCLATVERVLDALDYSNSPVVETLISNPRLVS
ncbi:hypothetical protein Tco_0091830 [Tanacetum coccineum]